MTQVLQIHYFYDRYLANFYAERPHLVSAPYDIQLRELFLDGFSAVHLFTDALTALGSLAELVVANCFPLQKMWALENGIIWDDANPGQSAFQVVQAQVKKFQPEVLYISHPVELDSSFIRTLDSRPAVVAGWRAAKFPAQTDFTEFDLILTHDHELIPELQHAGAKKIEIFHPGFPRYLAERYKATRKDINLFFSGSWTNLHTKRNALLSQIIRDPKLKNILSLSLHLHKASDCIVPPEVQEVDQGELWGSKLYQQMSQAVLVLNATTDYQAGEAGNMRTFEATGLGCAVLTPEHPSVVNFFEPEKEIITYRSTAELLEKIAFYSENQVDAGNIGKRARARCLRDYSLENQAGKMLALFEAVRTNTRHKQQASSTSKPDEETVLPLKVSRTTDLVEDLRTKAGLPAQANMSAVASDVLALFTAQMVAPEKYGLSHSDVQLSDQETDLRKEIITDLEAQDGTAALVKIAALKRLQFDTPDVDLLRAKAFLTLSRESDARESLLEELRNNPKNAEARTLLQSLTEGSEKLYPSFGYAEQHPEFGKILQLIRPYTMLEEHRLFCIYTLAQQLAQSNVPGNFVECGVAGGGSSALMARVIKDYSTIPRKVFACDSFEGMPAPTVEDTQQGMDAEATGWGTGTCSAPEASVQAACAAVGAPDLLITVKGYFEESLPVHKAKFESIVFLHIDCDWYESTKTVLNELYDLVVPGGIIQLDDIGTWDGMEKAIQEFLAERNLQIELQNIGGAAWLQKPTQATGCHEVV